MEDQSIIDGLGALFGNSIKEKNFEEAIRSSAAEQGLVELPTFLYPELQCDFQEAGRIRYFLTFFSNFDRFGLPTRDLRIHRIPLKKTAKYVLICENNGWRIFL
jgi:hypothetical protein